MADAYLGVQPEWKHSLKFGARRVPALVGVAIVGGLAVLGMTLLLVIPGIWLFVMYAVAVPALLLERVGRVQSLKRSFRLVKGRWWATFGTLLVSTVLAGIVGALVQSLITIIPSLLADGNTPARSRSLKRRGRHGRRDDHHAVLGGGGRAPVLRPARAQGGASTSSCSPIGRRRRARSRRAAARAAARRRVDARGARAGALLAAAAGLEARAAGARSARAARARHLAAAATRGPGGAVSDPGAARAEARDILSERRFQEHGLPDPFRDVLDRVAAWVDSFLGLFDELGLPGGRPAVWLLLALLAGSAALLAAGRLIRRRREGVPARAAAAALAREDPDALERRAREAAAHGDHELALRLGFRAGVVRLHRRGRIDAEESLSTGEVARAVGAPGFDRAAARFDEVVYGRRPAAAGDVEAARAAWDEALR